MINKKFNVKYSKIIRIIFQTKKMEKTMKKTNNKILIIATPHHQAKTHKKNQRKEKGNKIITVLVKMKETQKNIRKRKLLLKVKKKAKNLT